MLDDLIAVFVCLIVFNLGLFDCLLWTIKVVPNNFLGGEEVLPRILCVQDRRRSRKENLLAIKARHESAKVVTSHKKQVGTSLPPYLPTQKLMNLEFPWKQVDQT